MYVSNKNYDEEKDHKDRENDRINKEQISHNSDKRNNIEKHNKQMIQYYLN